jgi:hypothetical protein
MPKRTIVAATWQIDTNNGGTTSFESLDVTGIFPLATKISTMTRIVTDFYNTATAALPQGGIPPLFIFVAPEYYFKRTLTQRCLTKDERDQTRTAMSVLARSMPNLLLIPGTIMWRKPLVKKAFTKATQRMDTRVAMGGYTGATAVPEPTKGGMFSKSKATGDAAYNTAYLYMGERVMKYHKMEYVGELAAEDTGVVFVPGDGNNVFTVSGLKIGVEICGDHECHRLKQAVDIHIVTSASVTRTDAHVMAKDGGLYIRANSGDSEITKVDRYAEDALTAAPNSTVTTPQIGAGGDMDQFFRRRWDKTKEVSQGTWARDPTLKQPRKQATRAAVRLAFGGKLTTVVTEVNTI